MNYRERGRDFGLKIVKREEFLVREALKLVQEVLPSKICDIGSYIAIQELLVKKI